MAKIPVVIVMRFHDYLTDVAGLVQKKRSRFPGDWKPSRCKLAAN